MSLEENKDIWDKLSNKNIHKVPEGYFEDLPQIIQAKAVESAKVKSIPKFVFQLKYAIPVLLILIVATVMFFNNSEEEGSNVGTLLSEVSTEELIQFLEESEITTDEILAEVDFTEMELEFEYEDTGILDDNDISEDELNGFLDDFSGSADFL